MSGCRKECRCPRWGAGRVGCAAVVCKALHPVLCARMASGRYPSRITGLRSRHIMHQRTRCSLRIPGPRLSQVRCTFVYMHALLVDLTSPCVPLLTIPCLVHVFCVRLRQTRPHTLARCVSLALSDTHTFARLTHRVLQSGRHWKGCWRQCRPPTRLRLSLGDFCCSCHQRKAVRRAREVSLGGANGDHRHRASP